MFVAIFAGAGGFALYSDVTHHMHGKPATATLVAHLTQCTVEYQRIGEPERKEQWPCDLAEEFQKRVGSNKVKLSRDYIAQVRFQRQDGGVQEAKVDDIKLGTYGKAIGTTLPVVYAPDNPTDVRAKMSWETIKVPLILLAIGLPFLPGVFGIPLTAVLGWAFRRRERAGGGETMMPTLECNTRNPVAPAAATGFSRTAGTAPRASFGMRNKNLRPSSG